MNTRIKLIETIKDELRENIKDDRYEDDKIFLHIERAFEEALRRDYLIQRTKEACFKSVWDWMIHRWPGQYSKEPVEESFKQAIDLAEIK